MRERKIIIALAGEYEPEGKGITSIVSAEGEVGDEDLHTAIISLISGIATREKKGVKAVLGKVIKDVESHRVTERKD